jgi:hypothetical protein
MGAEEQFREETWEDSLVVIKEEFYVEMGGNMNTTDVSRAA